jgi:hypothetical protein
MRSLATGTIPGFAILAVIGLVVLFNLGGHGDEVRLTGWLRTTAW